VTAQTDFPVGTGAALNAGDELRRHQTPALFAMLSRSFASLRHLPCAGRGTTAQGVSPSERRQVSKDN
jgi:hypothetical protein